MKDDLLTIGGGIARTVALAVVFVGCALPSAAIDGLCGVNYYAPFALDYNELTRRGVDPRAAIRDDVAHFHRLGLDLLRVHCFDRQISCRDGSLADTVHLELLDYLVSVAASNGMRTVLTPIAWYGWSPMDDTGRSIATPRLESRLKYHPSESSTQLRPGGATNACGNVPTCLNQTALV